MLDDKALAAVHGETLRRVAAGSIRYALDHGRQGRIALADYDPALHADRATFVTLEKGGELRGCIGSIIAHEPLVVNVAENAYGAAFRDSRFSPLAREEWPSLTLAISILSPLSAIACGCEADLLAQLRPHVDGLVLTDGRRRGVFLPQVWETLGDPTVFVTTLKRKAGLPSDHWSPTFRAERFAVTEIPAVAASLYV